LRGDNAVQRLIQGDWSPVWTEDYRFVSDDPDKVFRDPSPELSNVLATLIPALDAAEGSIRIISPTSSPARVARTGSSVMPAGSETWAF
jgi:cardiolipin synthase C